MRCERGVAQVRIDGRTAWCAESRRVSIVSGIMESDRAGAIAFAIQTPGEGTTLIVVLLGDESNLVTMTWAVPKPRGKRVEPTVTWLGKQRVGFGYSPVRPDVIATWKIRER